MIADETEFGGIHASADQADNVTKEGDETKLLDIREASDDRKQGETVFSSNSNVDTYGAENPTTALMFNLNENTGVSVFKLIKSYCTYCLQFLSISK